MVISRLTQPQVLRHTSVCEHEAKDKPYHMFGNQITDIPVQIRNRLACNTARQRDRLSFLHSEVRCSQIC